MIILIISELILKYNYAKLYVELTALKSSDEQHEGLSYCNFIFLPISKRRYPYRTQKGFRILYTH